MTKLFADPATITGGVDNDRTSTFAKEIAYEAQAKTSSLYPHCKKITLMPREGSRYLSQENKAELSAITSGKITATDFEDQNSFRRELSVTLYGRSVGIPLSDYYETNSDKIVEAQKTSAMAYGREIDRRLLTAIISPVIQGDEKGTGDTNVPGEKLFKANTFADTTQATEGTNKANDVIKFDANTVSDIQLIMGERSVDEELCATLTPRIRNLLWKDKDFQDAENLFNSKNQVEKREGFYYKMIRWVKVDPTVIPLLGTGNIAASAGTTRATKVKVAARRMDAADLDAHTDSALVNTVAKATAAGATGAFLAEVEARDLCFVWSPETLHLATRGEPILDDGDLVTHNKAKFASFYCFLGSLALDDQRTLVVATRGKVTDIA